MSQELHVNIIAYDYSGYGSSTGKPHERSVLRNVKFVYNYMVGTLNINPLNIISYGVSSINILYN